jgi:DNA-binding transcriptional MerR regulator
MVAIETDTTLSIDEVAQRSALPVRTIREYQAMQLLPPPQRRGRVGVYSDEHLARLQVISRLQRRGYSLAGIRDLLDAWTAGGDLAGILGDNELPMPEEAGLVTTRAALAASLEHLPADAVSELESYGLIRAMEGDRVCVRSPSLLRLVADAAANGVPAENAVALARTVSVAMRALASELADVLRPALADDTRTDERIALVRRGRALLAQGTASLLIHELADALGGADGDPALARLVDAARLHGTPEDRA